MSYGTGSVLPPAQIQTNYNTIDASPRPTDTSTCSYKVRNMMWTVCCIPDEEVAKNYKTSTCKKVCCLACCIFGCGWCLLPVTLCGALCIAPESKCPEKCPHPMTVCFQRRTQDFAETFCVGK